MAYSQQTYSILLHRKFSHADNVGLSVWVSGIRKEADDRVSNLIKDLAWLSSLSCYESQSQIKNTLTNALMLFS